MRQGDHGRSDYFLGETSEEARRLTEMAAALAPDAARLFDDVGVAAGWRAADVGCGPLGALDLLSARVGAAGRVVGIERCAEFAHAARRAIAARGWGDWSNVDVVCADVRDSGMRDDSFDVVHERLTLIQASEPAALLRAMTGLASPGGLVIAEEFDCASWACHPPDRSWDVLLDVFTTVAQDGGADITFGRTLPSRLRAAGLKEIRAVAHVHTPQPGEYLRSHLPSLLDSVRATALSRKLLTAGQWTGLTARLRAHLDDPRTFVVGQTLIQARGRKAASGDGEGPAPDAGARR